MDKENRKYKNVGFRKKPFVLPSLGDNCVRFS